MTRWARKGMRLGAVFALALTGCTLVENLQGADAELARGVAAKQCVIGVQQPNEGWRHEHVKKIRLGKVSKRNGYTSFSALLPIQADRVYVHGIQAKDDGWTVVDASSDGVRDNLYFNRNTGAFACSTDEWRTVRYFPKRFSFEKSSLIKSGTPR